MNKKQKDERRRRVRGIQKKNRKINSAREQQRLQRKFREAFKQKETKSKSDELGILANEEIIDIAVS